MTSSSKAGRIIHGNSLEKLKELPDESVDMVMTSPPYWALRDYGVEGQLGLEPTFQEYINKLCDIFDEVRRVLKKEGTCWVNMGDTYAGSGGNHKACGGKGTQKIQNAERKCLLQIPSRFAIEMCNRGWILRNEIIWHKPSCMPSSVKDRFTVDFEKVFFFTKSKKYYFETQYEPQISPNVDMPKTIQVSGNETQFISKGQHRLTEKGTTPHFNPNSQGRNKRCVWRITTKP